MPVKLTFLGAAGTVTGSRYLLETGDRRVLVDCGLFQGPKEVRNRNWEGPGFDVSTLDAVVLTHAHVDHCAYLPVLVKNGYRRPIYATPATIDLAGLILPDSAHLQEEDAAYANKKGYSSHKPAEPLYTGADAQATLALFRPLPYHELREVFRGFAVRPGDAGHILGSANLLVRVETGTGPITIAFSGDVGRYNQPILNDPEPIEAADYALCESTYGDRMHPKETPDAELARAVDDVVARRGVIVIPAFAIGRTQELLYTLRELVRAGRIPEIPVYLDSPMAISATRIYGQHDEDYDADARLLLRDGTPPLSYGDLHVAARRDESIAINKVRGPAIIISANGMATGGRILHHLSQRLPHAENMLLFVGFQAEGTRGRQLVSGAPEVKIHGEMVPVNAEIRQIPGFSAHADQGELLRWVSGFKRPPRRLFLTHGEDDARRTFARLIEERMGWSVAMPQHRESVELT